MLSLLWPPSSLGELPICRHSAIVDRSDQSEKGPGRQWRWPRRGGGRDSDDGGGLDKGSVGLDLFSRGERERGGEERKRKDAPTRREFFGTASSFSQHAPRPPSESRPRRTIGLARNRITRKRDTPRSPDTVGSKLSKGKMTQSAVRIKQRLHACLGSRSPSGRFQVIEASYAAGQKGVTWREKL
ncbi:uncharacterized protein J3R85_018750 [Psidium guajava]|nr:uncharacterized protein J3R85_018750 [Psidium guajava]